LKFSENPPGAKTFLHILEYLNIPTTLFGVKLRKTLNKSNAAELKRRITDVHHDDQPPKRTRAYNEDNIPWVPPMHDYTQKMSWEEFNKRGGDKITLRAKRKLFEQKATTVT